MCNIELSILEEDFARSANVEAGNVYIEAVLPLGIIFVDFDVVVGSMGIRSEGREWGVSILQRMVYLQKKASYHVLKLCKQIAPKIN